ncbi:TadE-like protein [Pelotomaculum sp. FP]|uniref:TadE/TadG family type IV pilus assembly protein n=1 Tax=Pelotomaculum sp. FP TaxID=261474 RepID=UPI001064987F|nr:TadE/TadG family type IV pilus assembly protein [Pelotomaculum sp. FP]TEB12133.1 TadE-like protein [Pelotomaculum sp. FP]
MVKRILQNWRKAEKGQSLVEFAIILPLLVLLLTLPVDYFCYIKTKMILSSAASESIGQLNYASVSSGNAENDIKKTMEDYCGDRLVTDKVYISFNKKNQEKKDYTYYVYSSALADKPDYGDKFEKRASNYQCMEVQVQFSYEMSPVTYWGVSFLGDPFYVITPVYKRNIYVDGYTP